MTFDKNSDGLGFPSGSGDKERAFQCRRYKRSGFDSWVEKIPWRGKWPPTLVFLPGKLMARGVWWAMVFGVTKSQT